MFCYPYENIFVFDKVLKPANIQLTHSIFLIFVSDPCSANLGKRSAVSVQFLQPSVHMWLERHQPHSATEHVMGSSYRRLAGFPL